MKLSPPRLLGIAIVAAIAICPFFWATTFFSDDHLLLTFARLAPQPFVAFTSDQHGGEFYRPIPWTIWWFLGRLGGAGAGAPMAWPFALMGLALHLLVALEIALLLGALGRDRGVATMAAVLFFLSPATREAALWFVASPDLMAAAGVLGSLIALLRGRWAASAALAAVAYFCKESALTLPLLGALLLVAGDLRRRLWMLLPHVLLAIGYLAVRRHILKGWGGTGDQQATLVEKLVQITSGFVHLVAGGDVVPEPLAWGLGVGAFALAVFAVARDARGGDRWPLVAAAFAAIATLPLFGAGWLVGARYFYLAAIGVAWFGAEALRRAGAEMAARVGVVLLLLALGAIQTLARHRDILAYDRSVASARRAVAEGVRQGHRVFHVVGNVKDLDLAVKEAPELRGWTDQILVLGDVPASFAIVPSAMAESARFLIASPPLPPSGAYHFGAFRIVGLARRGDEPTLGELLDRFPDTRFIRLRPTPSGQVIGRDVTEEIRPNLD